MPKVFLPSAPSMCCPLSQQPNRHKTSSEHKMPHKRSGDTTQNRFPRGMRLVLPSPTALCPQGSRTQYGKVQPLRCPCEVHGLLYPVSPALTSFFSPFHSTTSRWKEKCFTGSRWPLSSKPLAIGSLLKLPPQLHHAGYCWWTPLTATGEEHGMGQCGAASA